jgi:hypothetical protein
LIEREGVIFPLTKGIIFRGNKMGTEQRNNIRFLVQDDVIVALRNHSTKIGKVKDISKGGLSFEHIYEEDPTRETSKKDIFLWVNEFCIAKVPCRVVYDIPVRMSSEYQSLTIQLNTRRCGVQFDTLSEGQTAQLDFFLKTYTKGTGP